MARHQIGQAHHLAFYSHGLELFSIHVIIRPMTATTPRATNRNEEAEQARFIVWTHKKAVRDLMPALKWLHHSPNGGKRDKFAGAQLKAMGVKRGFPDLMLPFQIRTYPGLVIEFKSATGSLTPEQKEWMAHFTAQGWEIQLVRSAQEGRLAICQYLGITPESAPLLE